MNFGEAIHAGFKNYLNFETRACRSEYWFWVLFANAGGFVFGFIDGFVGIVGAAGIGPLGAIFSIVTLVPSVSVVFRRLHDLGKSGWWIGLLFVPLIGWLVLIYWFCLQGESVDNEYGPPRTQIDVSAANEANTKEEQIYTPMLAGRASLSEKKLSVSELQYGKRKGQ